MQHAPVGMYLKALDGRYIMLNPEMAKVFDRPIAEVMGRYPEDVFAPGEAAMIRDNDRETLARGTATVKEEYLPGLDQYAWSMVIRFPVRDDSGEIVHIAGFDVDITKQKRAEAEAHRQSEVIHQREKLAAMGSLLAGVAHELNNPLSVVLGRAIMLEEEVDDPGIRASLGRLRAAAERCARIVRSFLALARQKPREPKTVDVRTVLDASMEILASGLRSAGVETHRSDPPDLPPVLADADELHQVFLNLIVNAQQAMESTEPAGRRWWIETAVVAGEVRIEVVDNGPGIPPTLREKIFDPFLRPNRSEKGTGLDYRLPPHRQRPWWHYHSGRTQAEVCTVRRDPSRMVWRSRHDEAAQASTEGGGRTVLVVDDEAEVVAMLEAASPATGTGRHGSRWRCRSNCCVMGASTPSSAISVCRGWTDMASRGLLATIRPDLVNRLLLMIGDVLRTARAHACRALWRTAGKAARPGRRSAAGFWS
jgi:PAS domain S-box-containing protein